MLVQILVVALGDRKERREEKMKRGAGRVGKEAPLRYSCMKTQVKITSVKMIIPAMTPPPTESPDECVA